MQNSPAKLILFCLCFQGMVLVPAFAQNATAVTAVDGRAGGPVDNAVSTAYVPATTTTTAPTMPTAPTANPSPADSANYVLGAEDTITVRVFAADDIPDRPAQIANDGTVNLPMVGRVHAAGKTVEQLQNDLTNSYKKYFRDPQVTVQVTDSRSQPVSVAGNVNTPGVVQLRGNRNLMEVIGMAGGLRADAGDSVLITRNLSEGTIPVAGAFTDPTGKYSVAHVNIRNIMSGKDPESNIVIKPHDVVNVPRARMIYVLGNVGRPGGYVLTDNETMSITKAIALAGGWAPNSKLGSTRILRADGGAEREQITADLKKIMDNKAPDLQLQPDDILYIPNSFTKALGARGLDSAIGVGAALAIFH